MLITSENYPHVFEAMNKVQIDCGRSTHNMYRTPSKYDMFINKFDIGLAKLSGEQLETFCAGDDADAQVLVQQFNLADEDEFLNDFFYEWEAPQDF